jgi:hypothetical protein
VQPANQGGPVAYAHSRNASGELHELSKEIRRDARKMSG